MKFYAEKPESIFQLLRTDPENGLTDAQISQKQKEKGFDNGRRRVRFGRDIYNYD